MKRKIGLRESLERATYDKVAFQKKMIQIKKGMEEVSSVLEKPKKKEK